MLTFCFCGRDSKINSHNIQSWNVWQFISIMNCQLQSICSLLDCERVMAVNSSVFHLDCAYSVSRVFRFQWIQTCEPAILCTTVWRIQQTLIHMSIFSGATSSHNMKSSWNVKWLELFRDTHWTILVFLISWKFTFMCSNINLVICAKSFKLSLHKYQWCCWLTCAYSSINQLFNGRYL